MSLMGDDGLFDDLPDVDHRSCQLLGPTALIVQAVMGLLVISSLVYKRHRETPKRPWRIWSFDVGKQVIGQMIVHGLNVIISGVVASISLGNACVLYFLNILIDTTLGVGIIYVILHGLTFFFTEKCGFKGFETGQYGEPPRAGYWFRQTAVYVFSLSTMKLTVVALFAVWPGIFKLGEWLLGFLGSSDAAQVIFTMGLFPIMMNILQFWLIDSIVKARAGSASVALPSDSTRNSLDPDEEPLFRATSDDEDDDHYHHRRDIEHNPRSRSHSKDERDLSKQDEVSTTTMLPSTSGSGSITPKDVGSNAVRMHAYPPSLDSSPSSSWTPSSRPESTSPKLSGQRRRRSPPPPLSLHPRLPQPVGPSSPPQQVIHGEKNEWATWDSNDDWAERVGEEDWTGRRLDAKQAAVQNVWMDQSQTNSVRIS